MGNRSSNGEIVLTSILNDELSRPIKFYIQYKCPFCRDKVIFAIMSYECLVDNKCEICLDNTRERSLLCIIEKETDLTTIEETKTYNGFYFILGGTLNLKKDNRLRIPELKEKIKNSNFSEIIIAVNPTPEGEATRLLLERELASFNIKITHLGRCLPVGGELEYADPETLESAFKSRS